MHGGVLNREGKLEVRAEVTTNWERRVDHVQSLTSADLLQGILAELNTLRQEMAGLQAWVCCVASLSLSQNIFKISISRQK